jgi:hypothetical protein
MSKEKPLEQPQQIPINTGDAMSRGNYSNSMLVTHNPEEFLIDWLLNSPNGVHLVSRVIVSPGHVRRIIDALSENLGKYEDRFGPVRVIEPKDQSFN